MQQCRSNALSNITNQLSKRQGVEEKQPIYPQLPLKYRNNEQYIQSGLENKSELSHNSPLLQDNIDDILLLSNSKWGLEPQFVNGLRHCGIERMHQWQADCLSLPGLFQGEKNLVYTAPTSAGKSLGKKEKIFKQIFAVLGQSVVTYLSH
ncbi:hypothetical protein BDZ91DRAFT_721697 [Kalaharituber pfeilii]|nr:hypothetical protein BDZ91DRAFT_721697 [Kalaharituber pfeilii]